MQVPQTSHKKQPLLHYLAFVLEDFYGKAFFADYWSSIFAGCISFVITEQQYQSSKGETEKLTVTQMMPFCAAESISTFQPQYLIEY